MNPMISLERAYIPSFQIPHIMLMKTVKFKLSFSEEETALVNYVTLNDKDRLTNFMIKYGWSNAIFFIKSYTNLKFVSKTVFSSKTIFKSKTHFPLISIIKVHSLVHEMFSKCLKN